MSLFALGGGSKAGNGMGPPLSLGTVVGTTSSRSSSDGVGGNELSSVDVELSAMDIELSAVDVELIESWPP